MSSVSAQMSDLGFSNVSPHEFLATFIAYCDMGWDLDCPDFDPFIDGVSYQDCCKLAAFLVDSGY